MLDVGLFLDIQLKAVSESCSKKSYALPFMADEMNAVVFAGKLQFCLRSSRRYEAWSVVSSLGSSAGN